MQLEKLLLDLAKKQLETHPELGNIANLMAEFQHAPWDYRVLGPSSLEDEASIYICLSVGKAHKAYDIVLSLDLETMIISTAEVNTPKIHTLSKGGK